MRAGEVLFGWRRDWPSKVGRKLGLNTFFPMYVFEYVGATISIVLLTDGINVQNDDEDYEGVKH